MRYPVHCTGEPAFAILKETFGDRYIYAGLGTTLLLGPKVTVKAEAGQPNKSAMDQEDLSGYREAMMRGPLRAFFAGDRRLARAQQCLCRNVKEEGPPVRAALPLSSRDPAKPA